MSGTIIYNPSRRGWVSVVPALNENYTNYTSKPTRTTNGIMRGYSLPVFSANGEELFYTGRAPFTWDGITNPHFQAIISLQASETVGDYFEFQLQYAVVPVIGSIPTGVTATVNQELVVLSGRNAARQAYYLSMELNAADINVGDNIHFNLYRILPTHEPGITYEIKLWDVDTRWKIDKTQSKELMS